MRGIICGILLSALAASGHAQTRSGGPAPIDRYFVGPLTSPVNLNNNPLSQTASQTVDITKTNLVILVAGQSNIGDVAPSAFSPVNASALFQLSIYDGKVYPAVDPLLGTNNPTGFIGNPALRIADALVTAGFFQRIYLVPIAIGNTAIADWASGLEAQLIPVAFLRMTQRGLVTGTNITVVGLWADGENDTSLGTSQAAYTAGLSTVLAQSRTAGFSGTWFVAKQSYNGTTTSANVQAGQAAVVSHPGVWAGPNADALVGNVCGPSANAACRQGDGVHFSDNGSFSYAAIWVTAIEAFGAPF